MNARAVIVLTVVLRTTKMTKNGLGTKLKGEFLVTKPNMYLQMTSEISKKQMSTKNERIQKHLIFLVGILWLRIKCNYYTN